MLNWNFFKGDSGGDDKKGKKGKNKKGKKEKEKGGKEKTKTKAEEGSWSKKLSLN